MYIYISVYLYMCMHVYIYIYIIIYIEYTSIILSGNLVQHVHTLALVPSFQSADKAPTITIRVSIGHSAHIGYTTWPKLIEWSCCAAKIIQVRPVALLNKEQQNKTVQHIPRHVRQNPKNCEKRLTRATPEVCK